MKGTPNVVEQKDGALLEHDLHLNKAKCFSFVTFQRCTPHLLCWIVKAKHDTKSCDVFVQVLKASKVHI